MKFYMAAGRLVGTQAEAKDLDRNFEQHDVPTDKDGLMAYVNDLLERIDQASGGAQPEGAVVTPELEPASAPELAPPPPRAPQPDEADTRRKLALALRGMEADAVEEKILEAKGPVFGRFMSAAIGRLGELGRDGFDAYNATRAHGGDAEASVGVKRSARWIPGSDERGLRYLTILLAADLLKKERKGG